MTLSTTRGRVTVRRVSLTTTVFFLLPVVFHVFPRISPVERAIQTAPDPPSLRVPSAPAFQLTRYYRYGELDTCEGRWAAIWACMDRSKRYVRWWEKYRQNNLFVFVFVFVFF